MTFANVGTLGVLPGHRDSLIGMLTQRSTRLAEYGCLSYEVGHRSDEPNRVDVVEMWRDEESHDAALEEPDVIAFMAEARAHMTGEFEGYSFTVAGSPLRG